MTTPTDGLRLDIDALAELLPCPFCGGPAYVSYVTGMANHYGVFCSNSQCGVQVRIRCADGHGPGCSSQDESAKTRAVNIWNRRAALPSEQTEPVASSVLGNDDDLHSVAHGAYEGSICCDYQSHRVADFQDHGLALAATVLFNNAKAIKAALASPSPAGMKVKALPDDNDGVEQDAFEEWAKAKGFDMEQHPLHWLFLNKQTSAAREGWRAALRHAHARILSALDLGEPK